MKLVNKIILSLFLFLSSVLVFSSDDIRGYSLVELNRMFSGINYNTLYNLNVDPFYMALTSEESRELMFNRYQQNSRGFLSIANIILPSSGSIFQGDFSTGIKTITINTLGFGVMLGFGYNLIDEYFNESSADSIILRDKIVIGSTALLMLIWDIYQISSPARYEKKYNKLLLEKLGYSSLYSPSLLEDEYNF
ncbi:MAG: hypothetical protein JXR64_04405 [Spirochaetales bacterium]|nr:hypothetical protein [Spirochaetales bacterium]